jgi:uncharacterized integral membrane protein
MKKEPLVRFTPPIKVALEYLDFVKSNPDHRIASSEYIENLARQRSRMMREAALFYGVALICAYLILALDDTSNITVSFAAVTFEAPLSKSLLAAATTFAFMFFCARGANGLIAQAIIYAAAMPRSLFLRDNVTPDEIEEAEINELYVADIDASYLYASALRPRKLLFESNFLHKTTFATFMIAGVISTLLQFALIAVALVSFADAQERFSLWHLFGLLCLTQVSLATLLVSSLFWRFGFGRQHSAASKASA